MNNVINYNQIKEIYEKFVLSKNNSTYLQMYSNLPLEKNNKNWKWENKDLPRVISLLEFEKYLNIKNLHFRNVLTFNGAYDPELEYLNLDSVDDFFYLNDTNNFDLHNFNLPKKNYDFFMCNQTLEHVYDPCLVLRNVYNHLIKGGILYCNVPSFNMAHDTPHHHYIGFTPTGLGAIVYQAGFEILDIGFWGNTEYINYIMNNNDWPDYRKINNYSTEFNKEVISWIFAKKI